MNIDRLTERIKLLKEGYVLRMVHIGYECVYNFFMNPQKNRILCELVQGAPCKEVSDNISDFVLWGYGDWYVVENAGVYQTKLVEVQAPVLRKL